jgi:hypothetical protein
MRMWKRAVVGFVAAMVFMPVAAPAQDGDSTWVRRIIKKQYYDDCSSWDGSCVRRFRYQTYRAPDTYGYYRRPEVRGYLYRAPDFDSRENQGCLATVKAVGDERQSVEKAKEAASRAWAGHVRFHFGEKYIDETNAIGVRYTCSRSSVNDTVLGKIQESAGITHTRCQIEARPCRAQAEK